MARVNKQSCNTSGHVIEAWKSKEKGLGMLGSILLYNWDSLG